MHHLIPPTFELEKSCSVDGNIIVYQETSLFTENKT